MKRAAFILEYLGDGLLLGGLGEHATGHHSQWFTALAVLGRICSRLGRVFREIVHEDEYGAPGPVTPPPRPLC